MRTKEFLRQRNVPYQERDVSVDQAAAREVVSRSGQMGVPVTIADGEVIVGFDRNRLEALAKRWAERGAERPRLGAAARDAAGGGAEIGRINPGQPAERAGLQPGDVIESVNGVPIRTVDELMQRIAAVTDGASYELGVRRGGQRVKLRVQP